MAVTAKMAIASETLTASQFTLLMALSSVDSLSTALSAALNDSSIASIKTINSILNSISSPDNKSPVRRFRPGIWLSVFTAFFLPLFLALGFWQLNRASEKEQLLRALAAPPMPESEWLASPTMSFQQLEVSGSIAQDLVFLIDNRLHQGQFGYEVFALLITEKHNFLVSLGWVTGSQQRDEMPLLPLPSGLDDKTIRLRQPPENPLFGVEANQQYRQNQRTIWVAQSLTAAWVYAQTGIAVDGFAQLERSAEFGVGENIWQPTVMMPQRHRGYALQWFCMATALLGMFIYAGVRR